MTMTHDPNPALYLPGHPLLRTTDLDEARDRVAQKFCDHRLTMVGSGAGFDVCHNHVMGQNMSVNYLDYGADVHIDPGMLGTFYLLQIPLVGQAIVAHRGVEVLADASTATILNPDRATWMQWHAGCRKLLLQIDKTHMERVAEQLIGHALPGPIRFDPGIDLAQGLGRNLRQMVITAARAAESGALFGPVMTGSDMRVEFDLAAALLTGQASNIHHIVQQADHGALPRDLRRAMDFICANLSEPIQLSDIARQAGVNIRTLQKGFIRSFGLTPMQVLRNARLDSAHYQLLARADPPSVTTAAFSNGFSHLGRFSQVYKARFGHLPSHRH